MRGNTEGKYSFELQAAERVVLEQELMAYSGPDRIISSAEAEAEIRTNPLPEVVGYSDIPSLNRYIEGFRGGELIIISGPTKHGKTLLGQTLTLSFIKQSLYSLWFSYEMCKKEFISRFSRLPVFFLPDELTNRVTGWFDRRILEAKLKYQNVRAVFIDHLHFIVDFERLRNPSLEIGTVVRNLKRLAINHNIVIFLIAHTGKSKLIEEPDVESIRDSSFVSQEADSTLMIYRRKDEDCREYTNRAWLKICNHRRTGVFGKKIPLILIDGVLQEEIDGGRKEGAKKERSDSKRSPRVDLYG